MTFSYIYSIGDGANIKPYIEITGVSGGTDPYYYSLTGILYQTATTFNNLSYGHYTIYVADDYGEKTYEKVYIPKPPVIDIETNGCLDGIVVTLRKDDGCVKKTYTDENGYIWTIIDDCPCSSCDCTVPTDLGCLDSTPDSITVSWSGTTCEIEYELRVRGGETGEEWGYFTTTNTQYLLEGLEAQTEYEFQVRGICSTTESGWSISVFCWTRGKVET